MKSGGFLLLALVALGCAGKTPEQFGDPKPLYEHALALFNRGHYGDAVPFFESLRNRFPQSPLATEAELKLGDCHFARREYATAEAVYRSFLSLHPTHPNAPYALFRAGMTHFKRIPRGIDRDQTQTERAIEGFREFLARHPGDERAAEAGRLLLKCKRMLAERDLYVAKFYIGQKQYGAATLRLESLRANPDFEDLRAEAAYRLGNAYLRMNDTDRAREILDALASDPRAGAFQLKARKLLAEIR